MCKRYFSNPPLSAGRIVSLADQEAHHLLHVMRATTGMEVVLFDGSGQECTATVVKLGRREVELETQRCFFVSREASVHLTMAVALPKGDRQTWLVEKLTELGVARLVPLITEHSVALPNAKTLDRLHKTVISAAKQCGRNRLLEIADAQSLDALLQQSWENAQRILLHPGRHAHPFSLGGLESQRVVAVVGPEGGLSDQEVSFAITQGWQPLALGARILRIETAAMALAAQLVDRNET